MFDIGSMYLENRISDLEKRFTENQELLGTLIMAVAILINKSNEAEENRKE